MASAGIEHFVHQGVEFCDAALLMADAVPVWLWFAAAMTIIVKRSYTNCRPKARASQVPEKTSSGNYRRPMRLRKEKILRLPMSEPTISGRLAPSSRIDYIGLRLWAKR